MYIIGVTGYSGTGKSTSAKKLSETFENVKYIEGDYWMHQIPEHFKDLMIETYGRDKIESTKSAGKLLGIIFQDTEKGKAFFDKVMPWMNEQFMQALEDARNQGTEYVVCDWALLPALDIWKQSDMRVKVDTSTPDERYNKLFERGLGNRKDLLQEKTEEERKKAFSAYKKRDDFVDAIIGNAKDDAFLLENNFDYDTLQNRVNILNELAMLKNKFKSNMEMASVIREIENCFKNVNGIVSPEVVLTAIREKIDISLMNSELGESENPKLNKKNIAELAKQESVLIETSNASEIFVKAEKTVEQDREIEQE